LRASCFGRIGGLAECSDAGSPLGGSVAALSAWLLSLARPALCLPESTSSVENEMIAADDRALSALCLGACGVRVLSGKLLERERLA